MRLLPLLLLACTTSPAPICDDGPTLFGAPNAMTGLGDAECGATCSCEGKSWTQPNYTQTDVDALLALVPEQSWAPILDDPYERPAPSIPADAVCGIQVQDGRYALQDFESDILADEAGFSVTHAGICGVCSTTQDLAVYMTQTDLTDPVRQCGLDHLSGSFEEHVACLEALGFSAPCAHIWYWNTKATRRACGAVCLAALNDPYHLPDGSLNACLVCDEVESGPVFKAIAGRTRRNTGIASSMCRPCSEVRRIDHRYPVLPRE